MTGWRQCFRMLDGTLQQADTSIIHLESPIFFRISGVLMRNGCPICDVIDPSLVLSPGRNPGVSLGLDLSLNE